jgi:hypothetical protein
MRVNRGPEQWWISCWRDTSLVAQQGRDSRAMVVNGCTDNIGEMTDLVEVDHRLPEVVFLFVEISHTDFSELCSH